MIIQSTETPIGSGVFADRVFKVGEIVFDVMQNRGAFAHINHSCRPSCLMIRHYVIARQQLEIGDEMTIDYARIPFSCAPLSFDCLCGNDNCRGHIDL